MSTAKRYALPLDLRNADADFRERFWSKVDRRGPDECWEWIAYRKPNGYGQFTIRKGVYMTASRVSLALSNGPLAARMVACHTCDNPPCVNPAHLFAGSGSDNAYDSVAKGRANRAHGEATPSAKLTEAQVREIRTYGAYRGVNTDLASRYGVSTTTIRKIRTREKWSRVA